MRRFFLPRSFILMIFITMAFVGLNCEKAFADTAVVNTNSVNVRSGPGTSYAVVDVLNKDNSVNVSERKLGWCKINAGNLSGWIAETYLSAPPRPALKVKVETANLRSGAGTTFSVVGEAKLNELVYLVKVQGEWFQINTSAGLTAYINSALVDPAAGAPASATSETTAPVQAPVSTSKLNNSPNVNVLVNGKLQSFDVPAIIDNGRTMVPMAAIFKSIGADVSWDGDSSTVSATKGNTTVILPIGSRTPTVNGKAWNLDVPAKIVGNRTLAPLSFVGMAFGGRAAWDANLRQAEINCPPQPGDKLYAVIIDEESVNLRSNASASANLLGTALRGQQFNVNSETNGWYQINYQGRQAWVAGWLISPVWKSAGSTTNETPPVVTPATPAVKQLAVNYSKDSSGFRLSMNSPSGAPQVTETAGSITYVFPNCALTSDYNVRESLGSSALTINGTNQGGGVQIKVTMPGALNYTKTGTNNNKNQSLLIPNFIVGVDRQTFGTSGEKIVVQTALPASYTQQQSGNTMILKFSGVSKGLAQASYQFSSASIQDVTVAQQKEGSGFTTLLTINTTDTAKYSIGAGDDDSSFNILFILKKNIPPRNSVVVLDAGHGGDEIGSSGQYTAEKDINLAITLKTGVLLAQKGIRVEYTRRTDTDVSLEDRAPIANLLNAALFVSIHSNAVANNDVQGTESYYYAPISDPDLYFQKDDRQNLAAQIQNRLITNLGRPDRGVKTKNLCVLRNAEMTSALTEIAFVSNEEEERLLNQDSFQNAAARAIAEGIAACMSSIQNPKL